jgi:hypothetical protein
MAKKRKALFVIGVILVTGVAAAKLNTLNKKAINFAYTSWQKEREQAKFAAENAYFQERVENFLPTGWREDSWVQIEYGGWGLHTQCKWTPADSRYRSREREHNRFEWSNAVTLLPTGDQAIEDALNIIVRDKLWEQPDIIPTQIIPDRTRITVEFQVGPHAGKFNVEHLPPENLKLRQFFHKLKVWQADVAAQAEKAENAEKAKNAAL